MNGWLFIGWMDLFLETPKIYFLDFLVLFLYVLMHRNLSWNFLNYTSAQKSFIGSYAHSTVLKSKNKVFWLSFKGLINKSITTFQNTTPNPLHWCQSQSPANTVCSPPAPPWVLVLLSWAEQFHHLHFTCTNSTFLNGPALILCLAQSLYSFIIIDRWFQ